MTLENGSRIIVATAEPLEVGERRTVLPPHLRMMDWFTWGRQRTDILESALYTNFDGKDVLQHATLNRPFWNVSGDRSRHVKGVERPPWQAIHTLVSHLGTLSDGDQLFPDVEPRYNPVGYELPGRGRLLLPKVALFVLDRSTAEPVVVEAIAHTGAHRDQEAA